MGTEAQEGAPRRARHVNIGSASHGQVFYDHIDSNAEPRGINGPLFTRQVCGGANMNGALMNPDEFQGRNPLETRVKGAPWETLVGYEHVREAWGGHPHGLNVRVAMPVRKGDAYRSGTQYKSKHNPMQPPTGSTIALGASWSCGVRNVEGNDPERTMSTALGAMGMKTTYGLMGKTLGSYAADPKKYLRGYDKHPPMAFPTKFDYPEHTLRHGGDGRPPRRDEAGPIIERNQTNFVIKNCVDAIIKGTRTDGAAHGERGGHGERGEVSGDKGGTMRSASAMGFLETGRGREKKTERKRSVEEMQLTAARRADIEALVRGQGLEDTKRHSRLIRIKKLQKVIDKENLRASKRDSLSLNSTEGSQALSVMVPPTLSLRPQTQLGTHRSDLSDLTEYLYEGKTVHRVPEDMRHVLIRALKKRWDEVNKEYQLLTLSLFNLDTVHKVSRKEACEAIMSKIEKDVARLSKGAVYVQAEPASMHSRPASVMH